ncbi:MAG TPA: AMP-binding protein, partial [Pseudonocardia sp.]
MVDTIGSGVEIGSGRTARTGSGDGPPRTVTAALLDAVAVRRDRPAVCWREVDGRWPSWSVGELAEQVARAAAGLRELGVEPGDRVLLMLPNCPEFHVADLAVLFCGAVPVSVYNSSAPEQLAYLAGHAQATAAIVDNAEFLDRLMSVRAQLPRLRRFVVVRGLPQPVPHDVVAWQHMLDSEPIDLASAADAITPDMPATILYTSGTTGQPKGVVLTHANVATVTADIRGELGDPVGLRAISYLPMTHIIERDLSHYGVVFNGVEVYCCPDPALLDQYLAEVRPQLLFGSPKVWEDLRTRVLATVSAAPERAKALAEAIEAAKSIAIARRWGGATEQQNGLWDRLQVSALHAAREIIGLDQIRFAMSGAAPISPELVEWFNALGVPVSELYGLTETTGGATWAARRIKPGTVGPALPSCELRIAEDGEVLCRGPLVFAGYLDDAEKTAEVIDAAGWLHTGDIGRLDDQGYLSIVDRKKELIITADGDNVSPANLEAAINGLPLVGYSCVVGDARAYVAALVTLDRDAAAAWADQHGLACSTLNELAAHRDVIAEIECGVQDAMAMFNRTEAVKKIRVLAAQWLPDSDELTPTGKPKRRRIHEKYADEIEGLYTSVTGRVNPLGYNSLWHLRADGWTSLEEGGQQLVETAAQGGPTEQLIRSVNDTLALLTPIETYFAFPGTQTFGQLRRLFAAGRYDQFALTVARINRCMVTESYRAGGPWSSVEGQLEPSDAGNGAAESSETTRPYFEVLVVEELTAAQERALRDELRRLRRPDEQFAYELVVVPSIEDAVIAALVNFDLQACVIQPHFTHRSRQDLTGLAPFLFDHTDADVAGRSADERAQQLGGLLKAIRPELDLYLMSSMAVEEVATRLSRDFRRIFHHREGWLELHLSLLSGVAHRYRTPFFTALKEYSHRPTGVFHALPISQGKSVVGSHWARDMVGFYGLDVFLAETSATCGGLDSLLEPTGALREAQRAAGEAFGSHRTFFVTNGT